jgi:tetratricopeptide (TPR) repeat protein
MKLTTITLTLVLGLNLASCQTKQSPKELYSIAYKKAQLKSYQEAIAYLNKAIALDSTFADAYLLRGKIEVSLGEADQSCMDAKKAADLGNNEAKLIYEQYCLGLTDEQLMDKIKPEDSLARLYPNRPEPLYNISNIYFDGKQYEKAIDYCDKAIAVDPNYAPAYYNKGICLINLRKKPEGCEFISKAAGMGYNLAIKLKPKCEALLKGN